MYVCSGERVCKEWAGMDMLGWIMRGSWGGLDWIGWEVGFAIPVHLIPSIISHGIHEQKCIYMLKTQIDI